MVNLPPPPELFDAEAADLPGGSTIYRLHRRAFGATSFNPGPKPPSRFAFFGTPPVPVLYAAENEQAAVAETILHDVPVTGGFILPEQYENALLSRIETRRALRLAVFHGLGLRRLRVAAEQLTASGAWAYPQTVKWAQAAHGAGFDGIVWMSRMCNDAKAYVFFGDRCGDAFEQNTTYARILGIAPDDQWLVDLCQPLGVDLEIRHQF